MPEHEQRLSTQDIKSKVKKAAKNLEELAGVIRRPNTSETLPEVARRFIWTDNNIAAVGRRLDLTPSETASTIAAMGSYGVASTDLPFDIQNVNQEFSMRVLATVSPTLLFPELAEKVLPVGLDDTELVKLSGKTSTPEQTYLYGTSATKNKSKALEIIRSKVRGEISESDQKFLEKLGENPKDKMQAAYDEAGNMRGAAVILGASDLVQLALMMDAFKVTRKREK